MNQARICTIKWYIPGRFYPDIVDDQGNSVDTDGEIMSKEYWTIDLQPLGSACEYCPCRYGHSHMNILAKKDLEGVLLSEFIPCPYVGQVMNEECIVASFLVEKMIDGVTLSDHLRVLEEE